MTSEVWTIDDAEIDALTMTRHRFHGDWNYTLVRHRPADSIPSRRLQTPSGCASDQH